MAATKPSTPRKAKAKPSQPAREIDPLTPAEVRLLIDLCSRRSPTGIRNRALLAVLYGAGLRISEALALKPKDLLLTDKPEIRVHNGKGGKARASALLPDATEYVERWLDKRSRLPGATARRPVFCTVTSGKSRETEVSPGQPLSTAYVRGWLRRLSAKAATEGLEKRIHAHGFRHSHATELRKRGWDVAMIQKQLGHSSLSVTGVYLDHIGAHELAEQMASEHWGL